MASVKDKEGHKPPTSPSEPGPSASSSSSAATCSSTSSSAQDAGTGASDSSRKVNRKEKSKVHQKKYRDKKRSEEEELLNALNDLRVKVKEMENSAKKLRQEFDDLTADIVKKHHDQLQHYADLYRFGCNLGSDNAEQKAFLEANLTEKCQISSFTYTEGPEALQELWERLSLVFSHLRVSLVQINAMVSSGEIFHMRFLCSFPITKSSLQLLFPEGLSRPEFLAKVEKRRLHLQFDQIIWFNNNHRIYSVVHEMSLMQSWAKLVESLEIIASISTESPFCQDAFNLDEKKWVKLIYEQKRKQTKRALPDTQHRTPSIASDAHTAETPN